MHWSSFWWGLSVIPALALLAVVVLAALGILARSRVGMMCNQCEWSFAGRREIYLRRDYDPDSDLRAPMNVVAFLSNVWHDQVIRRSATHRQAWTDHFESLIPGGSLRAQQLQWAQRNGVKRHRHLA